jgi:hypothetical protein
MERKVKSLVVLCIILLSTTCILAYTTAVYMNSSPRPKDNPSKTFVYTWTAEEQNVTDSEVGLQINVTFTIEGSLLRVVTIINDTSTDVFRGFLVIAFDTDDDSHIDATAPAMYQDNKTRTVQVIENGPVFESMTPAVQAKNFYCKFDGHHYLYNATFLLNEVYYRIYGDLFQLTYERGATSYVTKVDHFGLRG